MPQMFFMHLFSYKVEWLEEKYLFDKFIEAKSYNFYIHNKSNITPLPLSIANQKDLPIQNELKFY